MTKKILVLPGDGIGPEIVAEALKVLDRLARSFGLDVALDEALTRLADVEPQLARIVEMRFFGGMTSEEIGEALALSVPTVTRRWRLARAWLYTQLSGEAADDA